MFTSLMPAAKCGIQFGIGRPPVAWSRHIMLQFGRPGETRFAWARHNRNAESSIAGDNKRPATSRPLCISYIVAHLAKCGVFTHSGNS